MTESQNLSKRSFLAIIFLSPSEPRLRAGWRLLLQTLAFIALLIVISLPIGVLVFALGGSLSGGTIFILSSLGELGAITLSVFLARRFLDKRPVASLGLKLDRLVPIDLLAGIGITFAMMGSIYCGMYALGWIHFTSFAWNVEPPATVLLQTLAYLLLFLLVGWNEELLSRGYHLQTLASGLNLFWGVILSSAVFGLLHLSNPHATWVSTAGIFCAGLFLAYGYVRTRQLWLSIGLHIGWNFFEGVAFGFPVSGLDIYPLTRITVSGPELWTGGAFGPEAGLIVLPALILGTGLIQFYTRWRNKA